MQVLKKNSHWYADAVLFLVAFIWGLGFVAQVAGMDHVGPYTFNAIRFLLGASCLLLLVVLQGRKGRQLLAKQPYIPAWKAGIPSGILLFGGATMQQVGIQYTTAGKAGFITGLYVVLVPIMGLFFKQKTTVGTWIGALLAVTGLYLLSIRGSFHIGTGDFLEIIGAFFWAGHVLVLAYLSPRTFPVKLAMVQFFFCGLLSLCIAVLFETASLESIQAVWLPLFYGGVISVGAGYTLQVVAQKNAHPGHAAILLSLEAPFAVLGGWLLLEEGLSARGLAGCMLMLAGMLISQLWPSSSD